MPSKVSSTTIHRLLVTAVAGTVMSLSPAWAFPKLDCVLLLASAKMRFARGLPRTDFIGARYEALLFAETDDGMPSTVAITVVDHDSVLKKFFSEFPDPYAPPGTRTESLWYSRDGERHRDHFISNLRKALWAINDFKGPGTLSKADMIEALKWVVYLEHNQYLDWKNETWIWLGYAHLGAEG